MKYGYVRKNFQNTVDVETMQQLCGIGCDQIIVEDKKKNVATSNELDALMDQLVAGDSVIVADLSHFGKTVTSLGQLFESFAEKNVKIEVLNEEFSMVEFLPVLRVLDNMERSVRRELTLKGLEKAKQHGRKGGRPHISQDIAKKIQWLFAEQKYSLREIAERCNVSLGTVYKYAHEKTS